jgi:ribonuclease HI
VAPLYTLRTDGGARGNPGPGGAGFVIEDDSGAIVRRGGRYLGSVTNNQAEYEALVWGLETALDHGVTRLRVCADSELVVRQINGVYRVKNEGLKPLFARAQKLLRRFASTEIVHVRREMNVAADELANVAMDGRTTVGDGVYPDDPAQAALFQEG